MEPLKDAKVEIGPESPEPGSSTNELCIDTAETSSKMLKNNLLSINGVKNFFAEMTEKTADKLLKLNGDECQIDVKGLLSQMLEELTSHSKSDNFKEVGAEAARLGNFFSSKARFEQFNEELAVHTQGVDAKVQCCICGDVVRTSTTGWNCHYFAEHAFTYPQYSCPFETCPTKSIIKAHIRNHVVMKHKKSGSEATLLVDRMQPILVYKGDGYTDTDMGHTSRSKKRTKSRSDTEDDERPSKRGGARPGAGRPKKGNRGRGRTSKPPL